MSLNPKQQRFLDEYLISWNASRAAIAAGYSEKTAGSIGHELLKKPEIQAAIRERIAYSAMSANEALARLGEMARADMREFIKVLPGANLPYIDWKGAEESGAISQIKKISVDEKGITFELHDSQSAIKEIIKQSRLDSNQPTDNNNLTIKIVRSNDDD